MHVYQIKNGQGPGKTGTLGNAHLELCNPPIGGIGLSVF